MNSILLILAALEAVVQAGYVPPAEMCLPDSGLQELSGCLAMDRRSELCRSKETREEKIDCFCVQEMLQSYYDCKSDVYKCVGMNILDGQFDDNIRQWHEGCDEHLASSTITTPPEPTLTRTWNPADCSRLATSCFSADYETNLCSRSWLPESSVSYASCACQPPIYSLVSQCQYDGNITCKHTTADKSNIMGYRECSYFWSGSETLPPVDMTSFLSLTDIGMKQTAGALSNIARTLTPAAQKTFTTIVQTGRPKDHVGGDL